MLSRGDDLGEISRLKLTCDNGGVFGDSWYCEKVTIAALASGREWVFHCGQWIGKEGVALTERVVASVGVEAEAAMAVAAVAAAGAGDGAGTTSGGPAEYRLTFYTGSKTGAGTDATVMVELTGAGGVKSSHLVMDCEPALIEVGPGEQSLPRAHVI